MIVSYNEDLCHYVLVYNIFDYVYCILHNYNFPKLYFLVFVCGRNGLLLCWIYSTTASVPPVHYFHDYQTVKVDITMLCNTICFSGCLSTH